MAPGDAPGQLEQQHRAGDSGAQAYSEGCEFPSGRYGPGMGKGKASGLFVSRLTRKEPKGHREGIRELEGTCSSLTEGARLGKDEVEKLRGERELPRNWGHWWEKGTGGDSAAWPGWHGPGEAAAGGLG